MNNKINTTDQIYEMQAEICAALANPVRLRILDLLAEKESTATDLNIVLGLPKSNLSQHLMVLKRAGILRVRNEGLFQYLSLSLPEIKQACLLVRRVLQARAEQQELIVKEVKSKKFTRGYV
jgi:ArsR family transcriptional regulator